MTQRRCALCLFIGALATGTTFDVPADAGQRGSEDTKKPSVAFKVTPPVGFSPLKVRAVVDVKGGSDDYADFYCPSIEWDWADGTVSESSEDCDPYESGKRSIKRRFSADHTVRQAGEYEVAFRMKQKSRVVGYSKGTVRVRPGVHDQDFD